MLAGWINKNFLHWDLFKVRFKQISKGTYCMLINQNSVIHMLLNKIIQAVNQPCCPIPGVPCMARVCRALIGSCIPTWGIPPGAALLCLSLWESHKLLRYSYRKQCSWLKINAISTKSSEEPSNSGETIIIVWRL
jgi:hypothetical protein